MRTFWSQDSSITGLLDMTLFKVIVYLSGLTITLEKDLCKRGRKE